MSVEQWDLTPKVSPYLDSHMLIPLLDFTDSLVEKGVLSYTSQDVATARLGLLRPTNMVEYAIEVYQSLHGEGAAVPDEMIQQKERVVRELEELRKSCENLDQLCKDKEQKVSLRSGRCTMALSQGEGWSGETWCPSSVGLPHRAHFLGYS